MAAVPFLDLSTRPEDRFHDLFGLDADPDGREIRPDDSPLVPDPVARKAGEIRRSEDRAPRSGSPARVPLQQSASSAASMGQVAPGRAPRGEIGAPSPAR